MQLTVQLTLMPTPEEHTALLETMHAVNTAASHAALVGWTAQAFTAQTIGVQCTPEVRACWGLQSPKLERCAILKASQAFQRNKTVCPVFPPEEMLHYTHHMLKWHAPAWVALAAIPCRLLIDLQTRPSQDSLITGQVGVVYRNGIFLLAGQRNQYSTKQQADLIYHDGTFGLVTTMPIEDNQWTLE